MGLCVLRTLVCLRFGLRCDLRIRLFRLRFGLAGGRRFLFGGFFGPKADFATGVGHPSPGGVQTDDAGCKFCHTATAIDGYHSQTPKGMNVPEFNVNLAITAPANGTHYVAGETPLITVTLTKKSDGTPVDPAVYTTPQDAVGVVGGGLRDARLYVYGPRTAPKPVLTAAAAVTPVPGQSTQLFVPSADPAVISDSSGF